MYQFQLHGVRNIPTSYMQHSCNKAGSNTETEWSLLMTTTPFLCSDFIPYCHHVVYKPQSQRVDVYLPTDKVLTATDGWLLAELPCHKQHCEQGSVQMMWYSFESILGLSDCHGNIHTMTSCILWCNCEDTIIRIWTTYSHLCFLLMLNCEHRHSYSCSRSL